jgi:uncharacterized protein YabN with tetrapyrrole methylase and pyrophosphatase domain
VFQSLPALVKARRIQDKVKGVGFDWEEHTSVIQSTEAHENGNKDTTFLSREGDEL